MAAWISIAISGVALAVSAVTAWLTLLRGGALRMTRPALIFFGPDGVPTDGEQVHPKVFLRTLLYSTARRGQTIESMHINLQRGESRQNFSIWAYGNTKLERGSGIFVGHDGVACNHHFMLPDDGAAFAFAAGDYTLRVFAKRVADRAPRELTALFLNISNEHAKALQNPRAGIHFDWGPDRQAYHARIEVK